MATIFFWDDGNEHFVAFYDDLGEPSLLRDPDGHPTMLAKFHSWLPEWQRKIEALDPLTLTDYFNHIEEVFARMPSPFVPANKPKRHVGGETHYWDATALNQRYRA